MDIPQMGGSRLMTRCNLPRRLDGYTMSKSERPIALGRSDASDTTMFVLVVFMAASLRQLPGEA